MLPISVLVMATLGKWYRIHQHTSEEQYQDLQPSFSVSSGFQDFVSGFIHIIEHITGHRQTTSKLVG